MKITENEIEELALDILRDELSYKILNGLEISPGGKNQERNDFREVVLNNRLLKAIEKLNQEIPKDAQEEAIKKVLRVSNPNQILDNQQFHKLLIEGVPVSFRKGSTIKHDSVSLIDFGRPVSKSLPLTTVNFSFEPPELEDKAEPIPILTDSAVG